jgi:hypothetical protein
VPAQGVSLGGLGTSTPGGTSMVPRSAPCACCSQITWVVVCLAGAPSGPRQANSIVSGRDCQAPLRKSSTTGFLSTRCAQLAWSASSSRAPVATQDWVRTQFGKPTRC